MTDLSILDEPVVQPAYEIWGQAFVAVWKAALVKGKGKVPFDPTVHTSMVYSIDLSIVPITEQNAKHVERSLIQNSKEWEMIQKSIKDLGAAPSEIDQKYVRIAFEPTGKTYTNTNGDTKNETFVKFLKVFKSEAECIADYGATTMGDVPVTVTEPQEIASGVPAAGAKEFEAAKKLLEASLRGVVKVVSTPEEAKALALVKIKASPVMSRFFTEDSPELDDMIAAALKG